MRIFPRFYAMFPLYRSVFYLAILSSLTTPVALRAQSIYWKNGVSGNWSSPGNWWGEAIPQAYNNASIENGGNALINNSGSAAVAETVDIGNSTPGTLRIEASGTLRNNMSYIGTEVGGSGHVLVSGSGSFWNASGTSPTDGGIVTVGLRGNGLLEIFAAARVQAKYAKIGADTSGTGSADIGGLGSSLQVSKDLLVGESGHGTLNVHTSGSVSGENVFLGFNPTGSGTATIAGAGSTLSVSRSIYVGYGGQGVLDVNSGATLLRAVGATDDTLSIGHQSGAIGSAVISGFATTVDIRNILVGYEGSGTLAVSDQATISSLNASIGHLVGSQGFATVSGEGSVWSSESDINVGRAGAGTLTISDSGTVSSATGHVGYSSTGTGQVYIDGEASTWKVSGSLTVGSEGHGTLNIAAMAALTSDSGHVGEGTGSVGTVNVGGAGSTWTNAADLYVGHSGTGQLNIFTSGTVTTNELTVGTGAGYGQVNVLGGGSNLTVIDLLTVGSEGTGSLNITTGATVFSDDASLGSMVGGYGEATVTGNGSLWTIDCYLFVGELGTGKLNITSGGAVVTDEVSIAQDGGVGEINVANDNSSLLIEDYLFVGDSGTGRLGLTGGHVSNMVGSIGVQVGSTGTASVFSGTWTNTDSLTVGDAGAGTLEITGDGVVNVASGTGVVVLANEVGSTGTLNIGAGDTTGTLQAASVTGGAGDATVNFNHAGTVLFAPVLAGNLTVTKSGTGTTVFDHANTYAGTTRISDGSLRVSNTTGSATGTSDIEIEYLGTLTGDGFITGTVLVEGTISPGDGIGQLATGSQIWGENGTYLWEIADALGGDFVWDSLLIDGDLSFSSLADHPFTIALTTLGAGGAAGLLANFLDTENYSWTIASVTTEIFDWNPAQVFIDTSAFANDYTGTFTLVRVGDELKINYNAVPEPSTWMLLGLGAFGLLVLHRRRAA